MTSLTDSRLALRSITLKDGALRSMQMTDGLGNIVSGLGGGVDQQSYARYYVQEIPQEQIEASYRTSGLSKKVHNIPATDAVRAGWSFKTKDVDINLIEGEQRRLGLAGKLRRAEILSRMYGGSAIMMGVGNDNPTLPLDIKRVKLGDLKYLHVLSRHQIIIPDLNLDPGSPYFGQPSLYGVNAGNGKIIDVHPSRMVRFVNSDLSEEVLWRSQGWGDPILLSMWSSFVNSDTAQGSFAALLSKAQVDTIAVPNFTSSISTQAGEDAWKKRAMYTKLYESMFSVKLIDAGDGKIGEQWQQFAVNWAGIPEIMDSFIQHIAAVSDIPFTRLASRSPSGMNATGDSDQSNYFQAVKAGQELSLRPRMDQIFDVLVPSAIGKVPSNKLWYEFNALSVDDDKTKATNQKTVAEAASAWSDSGLVPSEVAQQMAKSYIVESGVFPGAEQAYADFEAGLLEPIVEEPEETPIDPLIPLDPTTGLPTQNRESRLFAANDIAARLIADGASGRDAVREARRLTDTEPRPVYISRHLTNADEVRKHFEKQGLPVTVPDSKIHVTVIYSKAPVDWFTAAGMWASSELIVSAGGPRMMDRFGPNHNAVVLMFAAPELSWRHKDLLEAGASHDFDYHAHITLNYNGWDGDLTTIEPYKGELKFGFEDWQQIDPDWSGK